MDEYFKMGVEAFDPYKSKIRSCPWSRWPHTHEKLDSWMDGWDHAENEYRKQLTSTSQTHAGKLKGVGDSVWHTRSDGITYWCGSTHDRTYKELYEECKTIMGDLAILHPDLKE